MDSRFTGASSVRSNFSTGVSGFLSLVTGIGIFVLMVFPVTSPVGSLLKSSFAVAVVGALLILSGVIALIRFNTFSTVPVIRTGIVVVLGAWILGLSLYTSNSDSLTGVGFEPWTALALVSFCCAALFGFLFASLGGNRMVIVYAAICAALVMSLWFVGDLFFGNGFTAVFGGASSERTELYMAAVFVLFLAITSEGRFFRVVSGAGCLLFACVCTLAPITDAAVTIRPAFGPSVDALFLQFFSQPWSILFGSMGHTFFYTWATHYPSEVNLSPYWNSVVQSGYDAVINSIAAFGIIPALFAAFALCFGVLRYVLMPLAQPRTYRANPLDIAFFVGLLGVVVCATTSIPDTSLLICSGILVGILCADESPHRVGGANRIVLWGLARNVPICILTFMAGGFLLYSGGLRYVSMTWYAQALDASGRAADTSLVTSLFKRSLSIEKTPAVSTVYSQYIQQQVRTTILSGGATSLSDADRKALLASAKDAITTAQFAATKSKYNYQDLITLGNAQFLYGSMSADTSLQKTAADTFHRAGVTALRTPLPLLLEAQARYVLGDTSAARQLGTKALILKPDYQEAQDLLAMIPASQ